MDPPEGFDKPVFYVDYRLGNGKDTIHIMAGVERIYHFTTFTPGNFMVCSGAFAAVDCPETDCPGSLKFALRNNVSGNTIDKTIFEPGERLYADAILLEGGVAIQWVDQNGQIWRSDRAIQQGSASFFTLSSPNPISTMKKDKQPKKMEIAFSCQLFKEGGQEILFDGRGVMAVAYP